MAKAKAARFDYFPIAVGWREGSSELITIYRPMVRVTVIGPDDAVTQLGLLDTGADETILPIEILAQIGHAGPAGRTGRLHGIHGGSVDVVYGEVRFGFTEGGTKPFVWEATVAFGQNLAEPIFGHSGFLEHFTASFNGPGRFVKLAAHRPR